MKKLLLFLLSTFLSLPLFGQTLHVNAPVQITIKTYTVATLPTSTSAQGTFGYVSDGSTGSDCTTGGGGNKVLCIFNGSTWGSIGGGGGSGIATMATGSGAPSGPCLAPSSSNLALYTDTVGLNVWECIATNTWYKILAVSGSGPFSVIGATGYTLVTPGVGLVNCGFTTTIPNTLQCEDNSGNVTSMVLAGSGVSPGSYTTANITVAANGSVTAASNGSSCSPSGATGALQANNGSGGCAAAAIIDAGSVLTLSKPISSGADSAARGMGALVTANSTGVTANLIAAKDTSAPTQYQTAGSGGCGSGVAASTATSGTFILYSVPGLVLTGVADNAITAGHILVGGTTTPGRVKDSGQTARSAIASSVCTMGVALTSQGSAGGTVLFKFDGPGTYGSLTDVGSVTNTLAATNGGTGTVTNTAHGVLMGEGSSAVAASSAGNSGAPFLSGGASADGAYGALNLAGGSNVVTGVVPLANAPHVISFTVDGGGSAIVAGNYVLGQIPGACNNPGIIGWSLTADQSGSISIDLDAHASSAPPSAPSVPNTTTDKISASAPMVLSSAQTASGGSSAVSTWTVARAQWDSFGINITGTPTSVTRVNGTVWCQ